MIRPNNPCFGCHTHRNGQEIKAPCCHDSIILVDSEEYKRIFLEHYLNHLVDVEESFRNGQMWFYIYLLGKCALISVKMAYAQLKKPNHSAVKLSNQENLSTAFYLKNKHIL